MLESVNHHWRGLFVAVLAGGALALASCGEEDLCAGVDCDFGTCDSQSGECVNEEDCRRHDDCVPGYECADQSCEALGEGCEADEDCDTGVCDGAACVNPDSCESDDDCAERTFCGPNDTCEPDPCNDVDCARGVCERGTDRCVSADECTEETEQFDCIAGEKCVDGGCHEEEEFCEQLDCKRGVCSFEEGECVNAPDCEGDDDRCAQGYYCNDQDQCQVDVCEQNEIDCGDNGECVPSTGACENATPCEDDGHCTEAHVCLEDTCRHIGSVCGDADGDGGCPGNMICEIGDDGSSCLEPEHCETSFDCDEGRQCGGLSCIDQVTCRADQFEDNDDVDNATDFLEAASDNTVRASLCRADSDVFSVQTDELVDASSRGQLVVEVDVPLRDRGLGEIELVVTDSEGNTYEKTSGAKGADGKVSIEEPVSVVDHGEWIVEVKDAGDLESSGLGYDLSVNLIPEETGQACQEASPLQVNQRVNGDTDNSQSTFLGSDCTSNPNEAQEDVYAIELDAPQEVSFFLEPQRSAVDLSMSVRSECLQASSERGCVDEGEEGAGERLDVLLDQGTHYLIVQAPEGARGGPYELYVDTIYTACSSESNYCEDDRVAHICEPDGGSFDEVDCSEGCNPSTGRCFPPAGDQCFDAPNLNPLDHVDEAEDEPGIAESISLEEQIDLAQRRDRYDIDDEAGCMDEVDDTRSDGRDQTYEITLPAQTGMTAEVNFASEVEGSLYLVEDCGAVDDTCVASAVDSSEEDNIEKLQHTNFSESDEKTLYLIVDTAGGQSVSTANLEVTFDPVICEPEHEQCSSSDNVETCTDYGTEYVETEECEYGCRTGMCLTGEECDVAIPAHHGFSDTQSYDGGNEVDPYASGDYGECNFSSSEDTEGHDYVYEVDLKKDEILRVTYSDGLTSTIMYLMNDCNQDDTCVDNTVSDSSGELRYLAEQDETVYVVVDRTFSSQSSATYDVDFEIKPVECDPATDDLECKDSSNLRWCEEPGLWIDYACDGGCSDAECGNPQGEICHDPIPLEDGDSYTNDYTGGNHLDPVADGDTGNCDFGFYSLPGEEYIYSVDLQAGETLDASYSGGSFATIMYLLTDCLDSGTCEENSSRGSSGSLSYTASQDETVFLAVDRTSSFSSTITYTLNVNIN